MMVQGAGLTRCTYTSRERPLRRGEGVRNRREEQTGRCRKHAYLYVHTCRSLGNVGVPTVRIQGKAPCVSASVSSPPSLCITCACHGYRPTYTHHLCWVDLEGWMCLVFPYPLLDPRLPASLPSSSSHVSGRHQARHYSHHIHCLRGPDSPCVPATTATRPCIWVPIFTGHIVRYAHRQHRDTQAAVCASDLRALEARVDGEECWGCVAPLLPIFYAGSSASSRPRLAPLGCSLHVDV